MADNYGVTEGAGTEFRARDKNAGGVLYPVGATAAIDTDGCELHSRLSVGTTEDATTVKASAGSVYAIDVSNSNATVRYLKLYNKASNPVVASDVPVWRIRIPASSAACKQTFDPPLKFETGIAYVLVTGVADTDATEVAANDVIVNIAYA